MTENFAVWSDTLNTNAIMNILKNENVPSTVLHFREVHAIRAICEADIINLDAIIADMTAKRSQKRDCADACTLFLSPVRRLPPDVLEIIFLFCLPNPRTSYVTEAPLLLTHVCSLWRRVAMAQSELWSELSLYADVAEDFEAQNIADVIHLWFNNARQRALSFFFQVSVDNESTLSTSTTEEIIPHINRIRTLELEAESHHMFTHLLRLPPGYMNELENLVLRFTVFPEDGKYISAFEATPKLRRLSIGVSENFTISLRVPWSQLTHLDMPCTDIVDDQWHKLLRQCHHLTVGVFCIYVGTRPVPADEPITLPHLRDLRIQSKATDSILDALELPALVRFTYQPHLYTHKPSSHFVRLMGRLQSLTLAFSTDIAMDDVLGLLGDMPLSLTHLKLELAGEYRVLCEGLTRREVQEGVVECVPRLEMLELGLGKKEGGRNFDAESFMIMIHSRQVLYGPSQSHPVCLKAVILRLGARGVGHSEHLLWESIPDEFMHNRRIGEVDFNVEKNSYHCIWLENDPRDWT